jgi:hypothetical protein
MGSSQCAGSSEDISILLGQPVEEFDERFFAGELGGGLGLKVSASMIGRRSSRFSIVQLAPVAPGHFIWAL